MIQIRPLYTLAVSTHMSVSVVLSFSVKIFTRRRGKTPDSSLCSESSLEGSVWETLGRPMEGAECPLQVCTRYFPCPSSQHGQTISSSRVNIVALYPMLRVYAPAQSLPVVNQDLCSIR